MEEKVSQYVFESELARMERHVKRWFIGWIITFAALVLSNIGWIVYENQYEDVVTSVEQEASSEGGGSATIYGDNAGAVFYGESKANSNDKSKKEENPEG